MLPVRSDTNYYNLGKCHPTTSDYLARAIPSVILAQATHPESSRYVGMTVRLAIAVRCIGDGRIIYYDNSSNMVDID
jgi:hypothetical protein